MWENYKLQNCAIFAAIIAGVGPTQTFLHADCMIELPPTIVTLPAYMYAL